MRYSIDFPVYCVLPENDLPRQEIIRLCGISTDEAISSLSERTIDRQLKELVELGHVAKRGHGRYCKKVVPIPNQPDRQFPETLAAKVQVNNFERSPAM